LQTRDRLAEFNIEARRVRDVLSVGIQKIEDALLHGEVTRFGWDSVCWLTKNAGEAQKISSWTEGRRAEGPVIGNFVVTRVTDVS
jgi:hypothetical protein